MSSARLRTDRLKLAKAGDVSTPDGSCTAGSPWRIRRVVSGTVGDSILITSAPSSARAVPHSAPAMTMPKEITLMPDSGLAGGRFAAVRADRHSRAIAAGSCSPSRGAGRRYCASSGCPDTNGWPGTSNSPRPASGARTKKPRLRGCGSWVNCPTVLTSAHGTLELLAAGHEVFAAHRQDGRGDERHDLLGALPPVGRVGTGGIAELRRAAQEPDEDRPSACRSGR